MERYQITGMSCAACAARVEKAVSKTPGVKSVAVNLLTNSMGVEGTADAAEIVAAVENAGYGAVLENRGAGTGNGGANTGNAGVNRDDEFQDRETPILKRRLIFSLGFLIVLMYFSMGHMMFKLPLPGFFENNHVAMGLAQLLLAVIVMIINQKFFISGFKSLWHGAPNMDALVALGSAAAFIYSVGALFAMTDAQVRGDLISVESWMNEFYFESAAMILSLITVGKMLEARSKGRTTDAIKSLIKLRPKTAIIIRDGKEIEIPVEQVKTGDIFIVKPGEHIPADGVIESGTSAVNESALTGESVPVDKKPGDLISAATVNQSGFLQCRATRVGEDTTLARIIQMVQDASATKAPIAKIADKVSGVFVPAVIAIAILTTGIWLLITSGDLGFALARGISVLVISCPCALGLATPVAVMVGSGVGAKNGILFKTAVSLEQTGKIKTIALDKTGTITKGEPNVTDIILNNNNNNYNITEKDLLILAAALERHSEHPLAKAIILENKNKNINKNIPDVIDFQAFPGNGLTAILKLDNNNKNNYLNYLNKYNNKNISAGNLKFIESQGIKIPEEIKNQAENLARDGKTPLFFVLDKNLLGIIAVADMIKADSPEAIGELRALGVKTVMLTGDHANTARAIGAKAGVDEIIAGVLPDGKEKTIRDLQARENNNKNLQERENNNKINKNNNIVGMVGDGINDAPALTRADIGIAIGAGTDVAIDAADIVLMKNSLKDVSAAIRLSRAVLRNIYQNLFWAFCYNIIGIPLAAGVFVPFGLTLNPMFGAAAMSLSSFCVVSNALRLNLIDIYNASKDRPAGIKKPENLNNNNQENSQNQDLRVLENLNNNIKNQEEINMDKKVMKIEGMMCAHCEARVKKALEGLDGVESAAVSHQDGTAIVKLKAPVENDALKKAVEDQDYKVLSVA